VPFLREHKRCALWAGCGVGKTVVAMFIVDMLNMLGESQGPTLVAAPPRVARDTWPDDAAKWDQFRHLRIRHIGGDQYERSRILRGPEADIYTVGYTQLPWLVEYYMDKWPFKQVIADESEGLKGFRLKKGTIRAHAFARVAHTLTTRWINLTAYPSPNGLKDLWGQTWFLDRGERLGFTYGAFTDRWFKTNPYTRKVAPQEYADEQIHDRLRDICLTLDAKDYFDLHEPRVTPIIVKLPLAARAIYKTLQKELFAKLENGDEIEVFNQASLTGKCLQLANGAVYTEHPAWSEVHREKIEALESIVSESGSASILVAYEFLSDRDRIKKTFPDAVYLAEAAGLAAFKSGAAQIGIAHAGSLGYGTDGLQNACHTLVRFAHGWNLGQRLQMLERIGPMRQLQAGFNRVVQVYNIICENTLDEDVIARDDSKCSVQDALLAAMKRSQ